jgi:hypothetical protein
VNAWYDEISQTIYYYSTANEIDMNPNASYMFYNLSKLEEIEFE